MEALMEQVLPFRSAKYLEDFREKMLGEGIASPSDMLVVSKQALETKLSTHAAFNFIEMADAISLRGALDPEKPAARKEQPPKDDRRGRSRSGERQRGRKRDFSSNGRRNNSRPNRRNKQQRPQGNDRKDSIDKIKPELWAACETNDEASVQRLLAEGADPEERFEGWTPLMKAAEEGHVEVLRMLLHKKVDIEASNKKGRTALSFAACPSKNNMTKSERDTPVEALRLLLQNGADPKRKDERGSTAKEFAMRSKGREDAVAVFEEMGC